MACRRWALWALELGKDGRSRRHNCDCRQSHDAANIDSTKYKQQSMRIDGFNALITVKYTELLKWLSNLVGWLLWLGLVIWTQLLVLPCPARAHVYEETKDTAQHGHENQIV